MEDHPAIHRVRAGFSEVTDVRQQEFQNPESRLDGTAGLETPPGPPAGSSCSKMSMLLSLLQQASFHPDVSEDVRARALRYGTECTLSYLDLLEHVLVVSGGRGPGWRRAHSVQTILSSGKPLRGRCSG